MKLWEALKIHDETGRKIRPRNDKAPFAPANYWLAYDCEFEVEPVKVEVTRDKLKTVWDLIVDRMNRKPGFHTDEQIVEMFAKELGL